MALPPLQRNILMLGGGAGALAVLIILGRATGNDFFTGQVMFIALLAAIIGGAWWLLRFIQRH